MKPLFYIVLVCSSLLIISCGSGDKMQSSHSAVAKGDSLMDNKTNQEQRTFIDAKKAQLLNDIPQAINLYSECLRINPDNDAAMFELSKIYTESQKYDAALLFAKNTVKLNKNNKWYQLQYAEALAYNRKFKEAAAVYEGLIAVHPEEENYYLSAAFMYMKGGKGEEAIRLFNALEKKTGVNEELILQKENIYVRMGKIDLAAAEIEKLISTNPTEPRYYGMLAELYEANNQSEKAMEAYDRLMKISPGNAMANVALAQFYFKKNDYPNYIKYLNRCLQTKELNADVQISVLGPLVQKATYDSTKMKDAMDATNQFISTYPTESRAYAIRGDLNAQSKNFAACIADYKKSIALEPKEFAVWQQLFFQLSDARQNDSLAVYSQKAIELFPSQALCFFFNGIANNSLKNYAQSIKSLKKGVPMCGDNAPLQAQFYSSLGDAYHSVKRHQASDSSYEKALSLKPDDAFVMNNYAYFLSIRNEKLERAEELSKKSNQLSANNSSFQDTYAWILFKQNKFADAKDWTERAMKNGAAQNPTILEHLGDIYSKLGDENRALEFWNKAKQNNSESETLDKKIAAKKYLE